ncbi:uncharacterized protein BKCO1_450008 [Diplodia corticola]|uniref:Uncharacterized protein n=1 Tax=Diplodia corticola TaxID=236234 RepID=A0A1J9RTG7_9PEZI|nr:uncharacterized protein BKCO1_450008 [Diplodia corticola]OJD31711.1 hypothetical protein BKCO1_450008 [Diplodia corticola]
MVVHSATTTAPLSNTTGQAANSDTESDGQARGGRRALANTKDGNQQQQQQGSILPSLPSSSTLTQPAGQLLKGAHDKEGNQKEASFLIGIKLDIEAEVHLTARVRGDISIGLY